MAKDPRAFNKAKKKMVELGAGFLDHRPHENHGPPIEILSPSFARFTDIDDWVARQPGLRGSCRIGACCVQGTVDLCESVCFCEHEQLQFDEAVTRLRLLVPHY